MTASLAQASPHQSPPATAQPKAGVLNLKVPTALVPTKAGTSAEGAAAAPKNKFQELLDKAFSGPQAKAVPVAVAPEAPKAPKAKAAETPVEKPKDLKKTETKESKEKAPGDPAEAVWASILHTQPKVEASKPAPQAAASAAEGLAAANDKAKSAKDLRKLPGDGALPNPQAVINPDAGKTQGTAPSNRSDRIEDRQKVFVVDRRSDKEKEKLKAPGAEGTPLQPINAPVEVQTPLKVTDPKSTADIQVTFQTVTGKGSDGFDLKANQAPVAPRDAATFQQYLVEKGYGQLVDQARIVLKDQNAGEIRMTLYPESLGKVKVALNLDDNSLAGQIYVENQTVKDVFQANMDGLMQAFRDGGYNDLSLQVSVGNGNGGGNASQGQGQTAGQARDYGRQVTQTVSAESRNDRIGSWNDRQINLTA